MGSAVQFGARIMTFTLSDKHDIQANAIIPPSRRDGYTLDVFHYHKDSHNIEPQDGTAVVVATNYQAHEVAKDLNAAITVAESLQKQLPSSAFRKRLKDVVLHTFSQMKSNDLVLHFQDTPLIPPKLDDLMRA